MAAITAAVSSIGRNPFHNARPIHSRRLNPLQLPVRLHMTTRPVSRRNLLVVATSLWDAITSSFTGGQNSARKANVAVRRGMELFVQGDVEQSVIEFDKAIELDPRQKKYLWQRGLSLYYLNRFEEGATQFRDDVAANPNDTEESIWCFLCEAQLHGVDEARRCFLEVGPDPRPVMRKAYLMFKNGGDPNEIIAEFSKGKEQDYFYAALYASLYHEAQLMLYAGSDAPEYHVPHSTQGQDIPSIDPVSHTEMPDTSRGKAVMEVGSISGQMPDPTLGEAVMEAGSETPGPLPGVVSPYRPYVNKGQVYVRRPTPRKSEVVRDHGDTDTMEVEFTVENLAGMVDAAVSVASTMATSHTEPPPPPGPAPSVSTMDATIIHVQPTAPSATQETQSPLSQPVTEGPETHTGPIVVPTGSPSRKNKRKLEF